MANLFKLSRDVRGNWKRQNLGVRPGEDGDLTRPTFYLGKDHTEATRRVLTLEKMWTAIEADWQRHRPTPLPMWTAETYPIALAVARGESPIYLDTPAGWDDTPDPENFYAVWLGGWRELFPYLDLRLKGEDVSAAAERASEDMAAELEEEGEKLRAAARSMRGTSATGEMLHDALRAYSRHMTATKGQDGYGRTQANQVELIRSQLDDVALNTIRADRIDQLLAYWCDRPVSKKTGRVIAFTTCRNVLITFRQFLTWLDRSEAFKWELPAKYRFPRCRIRKTAPDRVKPRRHFTLSELETIWKYALPWDRALILLALNCGFSKAEIATLQTGEVVKGKTHTYVKRTRTKTDAYGEWVLWDETLEALAYLKKLHKGDSPYLVVSKTGKPLDKKTRTGNENQTIKNHWDRLMERVKADYPEFHRLPFKCLRKTGANMVRRIAKGRATEFASMYIAHGEKSDSADQLLPAYTERPWKKLHKVILRMREKLTSVFDSVSEPWQEKQHRITPLTRERIMAMRGEGKTYEDIGKEVGLHWVTVGKVVRSEKPD